LLGGKIVEEKEGRGQQTAHRLLEAKAKQASKLAEIREALVAAGYDTAAKQAIALGVCRSTAWVVLNRDNSVIKRILSSPNLPPAARRKVEEYVINKIAGLYGHREERTRWFRSQFPTSASKQKTIESDAIVQG
jgi:hypothetical protein